MSRSPQPPAGVLRLVRAQPNPEGTPGAQLFLLEGDAAHGPIMQITPEPGLSLPVRASWKAERPFRLKIIHFNDLHHHLCRFTSCGAEPVFSRIAGYIRRLRRAGHDDPDAAVLALSAGDDVVGGLFDELLDGSLQPQPLHAAYRVYSAAGVDAAAPGNHDLDRGPQMLADAIRRDARFPVLSANLLDPAFLSGACYPAALMVVKGLRIGIVGLTTSAEIIRQDDSQLHFFDPLAVMRNLLPAFRPLCDLLIVLSHLGHCMTADTAVMQDIGDAELAAGLPPGSIDLIVGGHSHLALNIHSFSNSNIVNGVPILQAGMFGHYLGEAVVTFDPIPTLTSARLLPTAELPADVDFEAREVAPLVQKLTPLFHCKLGKIACHPTLSAEAVQNDFASHESAMANFITDGLVSRCRSMGHEIDFAMIDTSILRSGLQCNGDLTYADWFNVMPFADTLRLCQISGAQLKTLLEDNARRLNRPGEPNTERGFVHFSRQVRYCIDQGPSRAAARAREIRVNGVPLEEALDQTFRFACTNFLRELARPWERYAASQLGIRIESPRLWVCCNTNLRLRAEMIAYIRQHGGVTEEAGARLDGRLQVC